MSTEVDRWTKAGDVLPTAFAQRQALMPMWGAQPLADGVDAHWQRAQAVPLRAGSLAYVHIPFCANRCVFCGFYRNAWKEEAGPGYVDRVIAELRADAARRPPGGSIAALYLGGGTPTALQAADLARLLRAARETLPLAADCEITVEGRISHFDDEKVEACLDAGANRFSLGIQTFDDALRRRLGRRHGGREAADYLRRLTRYDAIVVADLIFGLPGQDDGIWSRDIETALTVGVDGLDVYAFNNYPSLPINRMIEKGALPPAADLPALARHYAFAVRRLLGAGWAQLSNAHFARPGGGERNHYNAAIKAGADCLAFGSGAGGCHAGLSYHVDSDLPTYLATPHERKPIGMAGRVSSSRVRLGPVQGGLEVGRLPLAPLVGNAPAQALLAEWESLGLLRRGEEYAELSIGGRFWSPTMTRAVALTFEPYPEGMVGGMPFKALRHHRGGHPPHAIGAGAHLSSLANNQGDSQVNTATINEQQRLGLQQRLAANPGIVLEQVAAELNCRLVDAVECLPSGMWRRCAGERFVEVLQAVAAWRTTVTTIVHTADLIMEFVGPLPAGSVGHGFYNLQGDSALHGHLRHTQCASIYFIERPFMGKQSACLLFANQQGQAMFKIFAGRDESGALRAEQLQAMSALVADREQAA